MLEDADASTWGWHVGEASILEPLSPGCQRWRDAYIFTFQSPVGVRQKSGQHTLHDLYTNLEILSRVSDLGCGWGGLTSDITSFFFNQKFKRKKKFHNAHTQLWQTAKDLNLIEIVAKL